MKNKLLLLFLTTVLFATAQTPPLLNYQGAARDAFGVPIGNKTLGIRFELLQGSSQTSVFSENQTVTTNSLGLFSTQIGKNTSNGLSAVNFDLGDLVLRTSVDTTGGTNFVNLGTQSLVSVPFSMHAQRVPSSYDPVVNRLSIGNNAYTLTSTPAATVTGAGIATVTSPVSNSFVVEVPQPSISITSTAGAAGVSSTGTNTFNINIPSGVTPTINGSGAVSISPATVGNNFTVTVPPTGIALTTTVGTAGAFPAGTNSFNINVPPAQISGQGGATVTSAGNNHTVSVRQTTITNSGAAIVSSPGTNTFNVHVPPTNVVMTTTSGAFAQNSPGTNSFVINMPLTNVALTNTSGAMGVSSPGTNSFNVNVPMTNVALTNTAGAMGVSSPGTNSFNVNVPITNVVLTNTAGAMAISSPGTNSFNVNVPVTNVVLTSTPGIQTASSPGTNTYNINIPRTNVTTTGASSVSTIGTNTFNVHVIPSSVVLTNTAGTTAQLTSPGQNSFNINVPTPTVNATGLASVSGSGFSTSINVPLLNYTTTMGTIGSGTNIINITQSLTINGTTLTSGPATNTVNLAAVSPWQYATGATTLTNINDKVGLGTAAPVENLQVESATNTSLSIVSGNNNQSQLSFGGTANHLSGRIRYDNTLNAMSFWTNNTADRIYIEGGGNVAIGQNFAAAKLDVAGNMRVSSTGASKIMMGAVGGINEGYSGIYETSGNLVFSVFKSGAPATTFGTANAYDAMFIKSNTGQVGIGTINPTENLQVESDTHASVSVISSSVTTSNLTFGNPQGGHYLGNIRYDNNDNSMNFWTGNTPNRLVIQGGGNVGIGIATATNAFAVGTGTTEKLGINGFNGSINFTDEQGSITFPANTASLTPMINMFASGSSNMKRMVLQQSPSVSNVGLQFDDATDRFHFIGSGLPVLTTDLNFRRVGVGTFSPAENFQVESTGNTSLSIVSNPGAMSRLSFGPTTNHALGTIDYNTSNNSFGIGTSGTPNRVVISSTGNVGINNTNPQAPLHINGTVRLGSEAGTTQGPTYPPGPGGVVIRRVFTNITTAGTTVAATPDVILERDGTAGGFRVNRISGSTRSVCNCMGVNSAGLNVSRALNNLAPGVTTLYLSTDNIVFMHCIFGDPYFSGSQHHTEITLTREANDYFWVGSIITTHNQ